MFPSSTKRKGCLDLSYVPVYLAVCTFLVSPGIKGVIKGNSSCHSLSGIFTIPAILGLGSSLVITSLFSA